MINTKLALAVTPAGKIDISPMLLMKIVVIKFFSILAKPTSGVKTTNFLNHINTLTQSDIPSAAYITLLNINVRLLLISILQQKLCSVVSFFEGKCLIELPVFFPEEKCFI